MARPERHDADYFPFYVKEGKTLFILESHYGLQGIGFFTNLMRFLTKQPDHHICIKDDADRLYFFAQIHCDEKLGTDMLDLISKTGKIDQKLWNEQRVIVSEDLLTSLSWVYKHRLNPIIQIAQIRVSYQGNPVSQQGNPVTSGDNPQSKVKKSKVNKTLCPVYSPDFVRFYDQYPKRGKKKQAFFEWEKLRKSSSLPDITTLLTAITHRTMVQKKAEKDGFFYPAWPDPERYLKHARWEDDPETLKGAKEGGKSYGQRTGYSRTSRQRDINPGLQASLDEADAITQRRLAREAAGHHPGGDPQGHDAPDFPCPPRDRTD